MKKTLKKTDCFVNRRSKASFKNIFSNICTQYHLQMLIDFLIFLVCHYCSLFVYGCDLFVRGGVLLQKGVGFWFSHTWCIGGTTVYLCIYLHFRMILRVREGCYSKGWKSGFRICMQRGNLHYELALNWLNVLNGDVSDFKIYK